MPLDGRPNRQLAPVRLPELRSPSPGIKIAFPRNSGSPSAGSVSDLHEWGRISALSPKSVRHRPTAGPPSSRPNVGFSRASARTKPIGPQSATPTPGRREGTREPPWGDGLTWEERRIERTHTEPETRDAVHFPEKCFPGILTYICLRFLALESLISSFLYFLAILQLDHFLPFDIALDSV